MTEENEREDIVYRGLTVAEGEQVIKDKAFKETEKYFAGLKSVAEYFGHRAHEKKPKGGGPALVKAVVYESDLKLWIKNGIVKSDRINDPDNEEAHGKLQLVFSAQGVEQLNKLMFKDELVLIKLTKKGA